MRKILPRDPAGLIVALHNNGPGYSVQDEVGISDKVALNDAATLTSSCCVRCRPISKLAEGPYNYLLQNTAPRDDDGRCRAYARPGIFGTSILKRLTERRRSARNASVAGVEDLDDYARRGCNSRAGSVNTAHNKCRTPPTAMPTIRNGSSKTQTIG